MPDCLSFLKAQHLEQSKIERQNYYKHNAKAKSGGDAGYKYKYVSIIMDGMDQAKTRCPHWPRAPKYMDDKEKIEFHLVGTLVWGHNVQGCYVDWTVKQQFSDDANALLTSLERTIRRIQKSRTEASEPLPEVLYLQLDNVSSNKNRWLLGYAHWLVHQGVFKRVKISFLLVGHTHENIDQFFSRVSHVLRHQRAMSLPAMIDIVATCSTPKPESHVEEEMIDFKGWISSMQLSKTYNTSKQHIFVVKKNDQGKVVVKAKRYSNSAFYGEEIEMLQDIPAEVERYKILPVRYQDAYDAMEGENPEAVRRKRQKPILERLHATHKTLQDNDPVGWTAETDAWWKTFLADAAELPDTGLSNVRDEYIPLLKCQASTLVPCPPTVQDETLTPSDLALVDPEYLPFTIQQRSYTARERRTADLSDLQVGDLVALTPDAAQHAVANSERAADVVTPFWVCEVLELEVDENDPRKNKGMRVAWYGADVAPNQRENTEDWGRFRFSKRFEVQHRSKPVSSWIESRYQCGILAYGFSLKKSQPVNGLPKRTLDLIKERLATTEQLEAFDREMALEDA